MYRSVSEPAARAKLADRCILCPPALPWTPISRGVVCVLGECLLLFTMAACVTCVLARGGIGPLIVHQKFKAHVSVVDPEVARFYQCYALCVPETPHLVAAIARIADLIVLTVTISFL